MRVKVYSTPACPYCIELKNFLKSYNVKYIDIDVSKDEKAANYITSKTGNMGVPQVEIIDGEKVKEYLVGFDSTIKERLKKLLKLI